MLSTAESIPGYETTYEVIKAGHGHKVVSGNIVTVHATVWHRGGHTDTLLLHCALQRMRCLSLQWLFTRKDTESLSLVSQGTVAETKKKFWSTKDPGQKPFTYTVSEAWCMQFSPQPLRCAHLAA